MRWRGTVSIGTSQGVPLRLHWFFLLFWGVELLRPLLVEGRSFATSAIAVTALVVSLFLRERVRGACALRLGLERPPIVLGPFGSLDEAAVVRFPVEARLLSLVGPAFGLAVLLPLGIYVLATDQWNSFLFRFGPVAAPPDPLAIIWGVNLDLLLLHSIPSYPFDGGRFLHALVWDRADEETALSKVVLSSRFCAVGCLLAGLFGGEHARVLVSVGLLCFIAGEIERRSFAQGAEEPDWLGQEKQGRITRWLEERRTLLEAQRRETEARERVAEEAELDELLGKVHREGLENLSRRERRFLARVGKKFRDRSEPRGSSTDRSGSKKP